MGDILELRFDCKTTLQSFLLTSYLQRCGFGDCHDKKQVLHENQGEIDTEGWPCPISAIE